MTDQTNESLIPSRSTPLVCVGCKDSFGFSTLFRTTWDSIPNEHQDLMLQHWDDPEPAVQGTSEVTQAQHIQQRLKAIADLPHKPLVELRVDWEDRPKKLFAQAILAGFHLRFREPNLVNAPEEAVRVVIAHELAHALHIAEERFLDEPAPADCEARVREILASWGFDISGSSVYGQWMLSGEAVSCE